MIVSYGFPQLLIIIFFQFCWLMIWREMKINNCARTVKIIIINWNSRRKKNKSFDNSKLNVISIKEWKFWFIQFVKTISFSSFSWFNLMKIENQLICMFLNLSSRNICFISPLWASFSIWARFSNELYKVG